MIPAPDVARVLAEGAIELEGRLPGASNATLRGSCRLDGVELSCVYKPRRGERPLWDFPDGSLGQREVAAYLVCEQMGWDLVPVTVWRGAGPFGPGMCQAWIEANEGDPPVDVVDLDRRPAGWKAIAEGDGIDGRPVALVHEDSTALRRLTVLDAIINNADRKGGHVLRRPDGGVAAIDHGLAFHEEPKLRTVLWGWAGEPLADDETEALERTASRWQSGAGQSPLQALLSAREIRCTARRLNDLIASGRFPVPDGMWPALPWPAM